LESFFLKGLIQSKRKLESFYSFKGIVFRAFTKTQQKTIVVLMNSTVFTTIILKFIWNYITLWLILIIGVVLFIMVGALHGIYTSFRYKVSEKEINLGEISYWL